MECLIGLENEDVNVSTLDFNQTFSHVSVTNAGFGYSMPVELKVIRGLPQVTNPEFLMDEYNSTTPYVLTEAKLIVTNIGPNGEILDVVVPNGQGGSGYINYGLLDPEVYQINKIPNVSVTGGGGRGAQILVIDDDNDTIIDRFQIMDPGVGYFNIDSDNEPIVKHSAFPSLTHPEKNATLEVRLGGYLKSIPRCTACAKDDKLSKDGHTRRSQDVLEDEAYSHVDPWIEIWDRGRSETDIDANGDRAHGAVKVVKGEIEKVVVTKSGRGYIDPVAIVRDVSPMNKKYYDPETSTFRRKWKCTFPRTTEDGKKIECGHIHWGLYPPEECPGETDELFKYEDENGTLIIPTADQVTDWQKRHNDLREHLHCTENETHLNASFLVRKCWGTKFNYILYNDAYYRNPREDWLGMDANLSVIAKAGKIREIQVDDNGSNYYASTLYVEGSGSGVEAIFVFDEYGLNTEIIFDDPKLKNLEFDHIPRPKGAGQGFQERPWSWDETPNLALGPTGAINAAYTNIPSSLYPETLSVSVDYSDATHVWFPGRPVLADTLGDRVSSIEVTEHGLYNSSRDLSAVTIEFNNSVVQDIDGNGSIDFIEASALGFGASRLTNFVLDDNATYENNSSGSSMEYGLFDETPSIMFLDNRNFYVSTGAMLGKTTALSNFGYEQETKSSYIRLNDVVDYEADSKKSFIDLYVDDLFPTQLFYGNGILEGNSSQVLPAMGNRILVSEAVPGLNWAIDEPTEKASYSYTDIYGQYHFGNLEPGMYNLTVFMEDKKLQETTFRPRTEPTRITQTIYVPGFPELTLESDNLGKGISSLVWSLESRNAARPNEQISSGSEFFQEFYGKKLEGVGRGFDPQGPLPELTFLPHEMNIGKATPNLLISLSSSGDGSLDLQIIDDENTTTYFPGDKFTIVFNSVITGVDFFESYLFSDSEQTYNHGTAGAFNSGQSGLVIYPSDAGGVNPIEVPLSSDFRGDQPFNLNAIFFEDNGTMAVPQPTISWQMEFDFNSSDGNLSRLALFEDFLGNRGATMDGEQVKLLLYSTLRKDVGSIMDLEILGSGEDYENGDRIRFSDGYGFDANITVDEDNNNSVVSIEIIERGFGISEGAKLTVWDKNLNEKSSGTGLSLKVFHSGLLKITATTPLEFDDNGDPFTQEIMVRPSSRNSLSSKEKWLDKYLDSFMQKNASWWDEGDTDDGLTNLEEWSAGTNPDQNDTDLDNITDGLELSPIPGVQKLSNPLMYDTDGDGWSDYVEDLEETDPRSRDTDQDGITDSKDLDPTNPSGDGVISGRILKQSKYGDSPLYIRYAKSDQINVAEWKSSWVGYPTSYYLSGLTDGNWTVQAFIDLDGNQSYRLGEPFVDRTPEGGLINGNNIYGLTLVPQDPSPILYFIDENNSDDTENGIVVINSDPVDVNDTVLRIIEQNITIDPNPNNPE